MPKGDRPAFDLRSCVACAACVADCPVSCLELELARPSERHAKPVLAQPDACISCAMCERTCPVGAVSMVKPGTASAAGA